MRALILGAIGAIAITGAAAAGPVTLKANPVDADGQVTFGDLFDGAGGAANVVVGRRSGPSVVFEAGQLQALAMQSGLQWANPSGLRRVVVRNAALSPGASVAPVTVADAAAPAARPATAPLRVATSVAERVINRNDMVEVAYEVGGVRLAVVGRAQGNAAAGQPVAVQNLQSHRMIDAVAVGPGQAVAGPAAQTARNTLQQFAAR